VQRSGVARRIVEKGPLSLGRAVLNFDEVLRRKEMGV